MFWPSANQPSVQYRSRRRTRLRRPRKSQQWKLEALESRILLSVTPAETLLPETLVGDTAAPIGDAATVVLALDGMAQAPSAEAALSQSIAPLEPVAVRALAKEASRRLSLIGFQDEQLAPLQNINIQFADLPDWTLAVHEHRHHS